MIFKRDVTKSIHVDTISVYRVIQKYQSTWISEYQFSDTQVNSSLSITLYIKNFQNLESLYILFNLHSY